MAGRAEPSVARSLTAQDKSQHPDPVTVPLSAASGSRDGPLPTQGARPPICVLCQWVSEAAPWGAVASHSTTGPAVLVEVELWLLTLREVKRKRKRKRAGSSELLPHLLGLSPLELTQRTSLPSLFRILYRHPESFLIPLKGLCH